MEGQLEPCAKLIPAKPLVVNMGFFKHRIKRGKTGDFSDADRKKNSLILGGEIFDAFTHDRLHQGRLLRR
jgi:hypothetical protein